MKGKFQLCVLFVLIIFFGITATIPLGTNTPEEVTRLYVDPTVIIDQALTPDSTFSINITVANVTKLWSFQFYIGWDPSMLDYTTITNEAEFLKYGDPEHPNQKVTGATYKNQTGGYLIFGWSLYGKIYEDTWPVSGTGTLATITFRVQKTGNTTLDIYGDDLIRPGTGVPPPPEAIPHVTEDGFFMNTEKIDVINVVEVLGNNYTIIITTNSSISPTTFQYNTTLTKIWFNAIGPVGKTGFCNVSIPNNFMWCDTKHNWTVLVNGEPVTYEPKEYTGDTYLYFTYTTSTNTIEIISQYMVPEFPPTLLILILIFATLVPVFLRKNARLKRHSEHVIVK